MEEQKTKQASSPKSSTRPNNRSQAQNAPPPGKPAPPHAKPDEAPRHPALAHLTREQIGALVARNAVIGPVMAEVIGEQRVSPVSAQLYLSALFKEAGDPKDPIERMLVEQAALAHHRLIDLHKRANRAELIDHVKVFNAAAIRLTGEFRRLALALRTYRSPVTPTGVNVQQVTYVDRPKPARKKVALSAQSQLEDNAAPGDGHDTGPARGPRRIFAGEEPAAGGSRSHQRLQTAAVDG
jgi:hypothetical protein